MNILVVGSGGREHALVWRIHQSDSDNNIWTANGNAGTDLLSTNVDVNPLNTEEIIRLAQNLNIDLVVVGPETPLASGLVDSLYNVGIPAFGPSKAAAQIESSKSFARQIITDAQIPGPEYHTFSDPSLALSFIEKTECPLVIKADGLAAGKGVLICMDQPSARAAVITTMSDHIFGSAGDTIVIEEFLSGPEVSVFAFSDGTSISKPIAACDYKRVGDGDKGPNTGGMGSYTQPRFWSDDLENQIMTDIMEPTIRTLAERNIPYKGVLYAGIMLTQSGPQVLEFNCRLGDPEAQVILPLLESDPLKVMESCVNGSLDKMIVKWNENPHVGVVMTSGGYPEKYEVGNTIKGLESETPNSLVFHAGTTHNPNTGEIVTAGGRVLTVVGWGESIADAKSNAYNRVDTIYFDGFNYRTDISD